MNGREDLIEASVCAYRARDRVGHPVPPPEWWDLAPEDAEELFRRQVMSRIMECVMDPEGRKIELWQPMPME